MQSHCIRVRYACYAAICMSMQNFAVCVLCVVYVSARFMLPVQGNPISKQALDFRTHRVHTINNSSYVTFCCCFFSSFIFFYTQMSAMLLCVCINVHVFLLYSNGMKKTVNDTQTHILISFRSEEYTLDAQTQHGHEYVKILL